jgi:glycerol-3-phosphate acyltransferase PlsY
MSRILVNTFFILIGYALGSLTLGYYIVSHQLNCDVRDSGSGSVGATNVGRLLGKKGFALTFAGDFGKGVLALLLAKWGGCHDPWLALVLLAVVAGHIWPAQLKFNGGKGAATAFGGLIIYDPVLALALVGIFLLAFILSRSREISGMIVFPCLPVVAVLIGRPVVVIAACLALAFLLLWAHLDNLMDHYGRGDARQR